MAPTPTSAAASKAKKALSQHELLESLVAIVTKQANEHLMEVITRVVAGMLDVSDPGIDARAVYQRVKSGNLLKNNSYAYFHVASTGIELLVRKEIELLAPTPKQAKRTADALTLVPYEEMDSKVAFGALSRPFEISYSDALATLNVRLGFLLERDILRIGQNPFRPEVFLLAMQQAWCEFEPDLEAHAMLLPLLKPDVLFDFGPMLEALNTALMRKGAKPGSVESLRIRKTDNAAAAQAARASGKAALAQQLRQFFSGTEPRPVVTDAEIPLIPDLPAMPTGSGGWRPSGAQAFQGAAPGEGLPPVHSHDARQPAPTAHASELHGLPPVHSHDARAAAPAGPMHGHGGYAAPGFVPQEIGQFEADGVAHAARGPVFESGGQAQGQGAYRGTVTSQLIQKQTPAQASAPLLDFLAKLQQSLPESLAARMQALGQGTGGQHAGGQHADGQHAGGAPAGAQGIGGQMLGGQNFGMPHLAGLAGEPAAGMQGAGEVQPHNVFYLPRLKESLPKGSLSRGDESTIDLLSRIFETVHIDENIPQETRELIHYLQVPVLKAALLDKDFFFQEAHPARRMIDLMSRMGWEQRKGADDPLFQAMQRSVERVGRDASQELGAFADAVAELEATIEAEEAAAAAEISEPIARALKQEKVTAATRSAKSAVALRVGTGDVVAVVETFLENKWTSVLTVAYSVEDDKPGAVNNATRTMDDLIWSVKPKVTQEQRKELIAKLPGLLTTLNKWLDVIKWRDAARLQFFAELAECHASIVRAPIDLSPERQLEIAVEVAQQDAIRRIEKENAVAEKEEAEVDEAVITVDGLERGMWLEFSQPDGSARQVKLAWVSPLRTLYIFSTGARQEAFSISTEKLAEAFRAQTVAVIRQEGVVARALSEAMGAVNDPSIDLPQAALAG